MRKYRIVPTKNTVGQYDLEVLLNREGEEEWSSFRGSFKSYETAYSALEDLVKLAQSAKKHAETPPKYFDEDGLETK